MKNLQEEALVVDAKGPDPKPTLRLRSTDPIPGNEALGPRRPIGNVPEKRPPEFVEHRDHRGRKQHGRHGISRDGVEHFLSSLSRALSSSTSEICLRSSRTGGTKASSTGRSSTRRKNDCRSRRSTSQTPTP